MYNYKYRIIKREYSNNDIFYVVQQNRPAEYTTYFDDYSIHNDVESARRRLFAIKNGSGIIKEEIIESN